jgi:hypothetical protein
MMGHGAVERCMGNITSRVGKVGGAVRCLRARADERPTMCKAADGR